MTASFFLPDTVASATKTSPLGPSTGSLCERTAQNSEEVAGPSTKGQHKTVRKLQDHPQMDSTKQWGNYRTIHKRTAQNSEEITAKIIVNFNSQHKSSFDIQNNHTRVWTRKVLCGSFLCATYKFSFIITCIIYIYISIYIYILYYVWTSTHTFIFSLLHTHAPSLSPSHSVTVTHTHWH